MKLKKIAVVAMAVLTVATSAMSVPASAANTSDANFSIAVTNTPTYDSVGRRAKENDTSTYVNYTKMMNHVTSASGPTKFRAYVYGCSGQYGTYVDCSSYKLNGTARAAAIVTKGTRGFIRQTVYEKFGSGAYARLSGSKYSSYTGTAKGCWSPDSVADSGAVIYN